MKNYKLRMKNCKMKNLFSSLFKFLILNSLLLSLSACRQQMADQPRYDPLEPSGFFANGQSARHLVPGTVARSEPVNDQTFFYTGRSGNTFVDAFPFAITPEVMKR